MPVGSFINSGFVSRDWHVWEPPRRGAPYAALPFLGRTREGLGLQTFEYSATQCAYAECTYD